MDPSRNFCEEEHAQGALLLSLLLFTSPYSWLSYTTLATMDCSREK